MARHNEIGIIGEDIAVKFLRERGYVILERNYLRKWGEIDIVTRETSGKVHFVEVKSVSYETKSDMDWALFGDSTVPHGTWRPEENVHKNKQERLKRAIQTWLLDNTYEGTFQIDIITVRVVPGEKYAKVHIIPNVVFE